MLGDVHGCWDSLDALLAQLGWPAAAGGPLWLAGDLVNGGPRSLDVLRWARHRQEQGQLDSVIGNHELYLLARAADLVPPKGRDTLDALWLADDRDALVDWVRHRPLLLRAPDCALVHAGLHPDWSLGDAEALARELEAALRSDGWPDLLARYFACKRDWRDPAPHEERLLAALEVLVSVRAFGPDGAMAHAFKGELAELPPGHRPWYADRDDPVPLLFGHWAAHGLWLGERAINLDSGCVWGGALTALRWPSREVVQQPALEVT